MIHRVIVSTLFFLSLMGLWEAVACSEKFSPVLIPKCEQIAIYLWQALRDGSLLGATKITLSRLFIGYAIGLFFGIPLGFLSAQRQYLHDTIGLLSLGFQTLPSVCWIPVALLWFGQTEPALLFVVVMGTLWSVIIATESGARITSPIYVRSALTMGSSGIHMWIHVILPASLPHLVGGMKQGWAFAWRSLMAAEIFVTVLTGFGLGQLLHYGRDLNAMDQVFGVMLVIVLIGLLVDRTLFSPWEAFLHYRWGTSSAAFPKL